MKDPESRSVPLTNNGYGSGSWRPKNMRTGSPTLAKRSLCVILAKVAKMVIKSRSCRTVHPYQRQSSHRRIRRTARWWAPLRSPLSPSTNLNRTTDSVRKAPPGPSSFVEEMPVALVLQTTTHTEGTWRSTLNGLSPTNTRRLRAMSKLTSCSQHHPMAMRAHRQCYGSMLFWYGSGSADPYHWLTDSDPAFFVRGWQDANKK